MTTFSKPGLEQPVSQRSDLIAYIAAGARPRDKWGIGAESERLVIDRETGDAADFHRIEKLLETMEESQAWTGVREGERLIALQGQASSITLEPGGQLELSGELCRDLHCCAADFGLYQNTLNEAAARQGLAFLGLGVQPFTPLDRIGWVPKARYGIMGPYMKRTGDLGQAMMKQSAGLQVNVDFSDEADWLTKIRVALLLSPVFYGLFANSPFLEGKPSGFLSTRGEIWSRTDPDRTGLIPDLFAANADYGTYVDYALGVPMYFIERDGQLIDLTRRRFTFAQFLQQGVGSYRATVGDWDLHLSTLFPEARLRPQIELRSADSLPPNMTMAVAALVKGLMYDSDILDKSLNLLQRQVLPQIDRIYPQSWRMGLATPVVRGTLLDLARELIGMARSGLAGQHALNPAGEDEGIYLKAVDPLLVQGKTLAEDLLERCHEKTRTQQVALMREHCGFEINAVT
jgi:glutamate--cysteine ligase